MVQKGTSLERPHAKALGRMFEFMQPVWEMFFIRESFATPYEYSQW